MQENVKVPNHGDSKIEEAKGKIEQIRRQTEEVLIKIKTDTEELDKDRRTREEKAKKERANKIQNEVIQSHKKNVEIDWNWQELEEKEDCKELAEDIEAQKAACAKIISDKQELIKEFEGQINQKDSHYIKAIQKMSEDIDLLIKGMKD